MEPSERVKQRVNKIAVINTFVFLCTAEKKGNKEIGTSDELDERKSKRK